MPQIASFDPRSRIGTYEKFDPLKGQEYWS